MNTGVTYTRVYFFTGRLAHLVEDVGDPAIRLTVCGRESAIGGFFGTGNQDEIDKANKLPLCEECKRRKELYSGK